MLNEHIMGHQLKRISNYKRGPRQVPGNDVNGYTSRTYVSPDGTFRIQIPRPDVEKDDDLIVVFDVASDAAIETEKVYREYGENFEGELVEKAKRGKKIIYKLHIEEQQYLAFLLFNVALPETNKIDLATIYRKYSISVIFYRVSQL